MSAYLVFIVRQHIRNHSNQNRQHHQSCNSVSQGGNFNERNSFTQSSEILFSDNVSTDHTRSTITSFGQWSSQQQPPNQVLMYDPIPETQKQLQSWRNAFGRMKVRLHRHQIANFQGILPQGVCCDFT
jgi:hypothetical protein